MLADTSSAPALNTNVVGPAAALPAASIAEPILANCVAAAVTISGAVVTKDTHASRGFVTREVTRRHCHPPPLSVRYGAIIDWGSNPTQQFRQFGNRFVHRSVVGIARAAPA
ncbi:hypothetical protein LAUMK41_03741 [Mycobacterium attenuatum]|nr:hypothetical protein LAUMK41_03741 [Mycobacterium attenuatum]